jgi:hypothetical protein
MRNTAYMTGGKPIAVLLQSISDVSAINPSVTFYDIHGGNREVLFFYFVPDTTQKYKMANPKTNSHIHHNSDVIQNRRIKEMHSFAYYYIGAFFFKYLF